MVLAALLAFCSPYPVRFAVEGKSYALLVLLVALGWWWRRRRWLPGDGLAVAAAAFTHFYGEEPPREHDAELRERLTA